MSNSIQFINKEAVIQAYDDRDVKAWAITQGKQFMFKGYGSEDLIPVLEMLENGATNAIYTLRVFEEIQDKKKIKSNTPDDGSFNFRLNSEEMLIRGSQYTNFQKNNEIMQKLIALEEKIDAKEEVEERNDSLGKIGNVLSHPVLAPLIPVILEKVMALLSPGQKNLLPASVGLAGIDSDTNELNGNLAIIVNELKKHDPQLEAHLYKLLNIAKTNPESFKQILNFFN